MFTVIEIQNGAVGANVWAYNSLNEAYSKYFLVLSSAAVSQVATHAATIIGADGASIASYSFEHDV